MTTLHALVTGAAGGIGAAVAQRLLADGYQVTAADVTDAADAIPASSRQAARVTFMDVSDRSSVDRAFATAVSELGPVHVLVNAAGVIAVSDLTGTTDEQWEHVNGINAKGTMLCMQAFAKAAKADSASQAEPQRRAIVNIASVAGIDGKTLSPPYAASKGAVITLTRTAARALAIEGIRVNAVCPGIIDTAFNARLGEQLAPLEGISPRDYVLRRAEPVPMKRLGTAAEVASVIAFLVSDDASYITGQTLNVDGGLVMQ